jgi:hypothetical protein
LRQVVCRAEYIAGFEDGPHLGALLKGGILIFVITSIINDNSYPFNRWKFSRPGTADLLEGRLEPFGLIGLTVIFFIINPAIK